MNIVFIKDEFTHFSIDIRQLTNEEMRDLAYHLEKLYKGKYNIYIHKCLIVVDEELKRELIHKLVIKDYKIVIE